VDATGPLDARVRDTLKPAAVYFGLVFGTGFVLGTIRTLLLVPRVGVRTAELLEIPIMLVAVMLAARWIVTTFGHYRQPRSWLKVGALALAFLLSAEALLGAALRGVSPLQALIDKDPISGTAYYLALAVFAVLPWRLARAARNKHRLH